MHVNATAHEVFATAESDLEPHVIDQVGKQGSRRGRRCSEVNGEPRRRRLVDPSPRWCRKPADAPRVDQPTALLMSFTRSVFSQEKPPSLSGARPKWP